MSESYEPELEPNTPGEVLPVSGLYQNWFLEYASYVILDRAIPNVYDGFKPVQRRIMHAMYEMHDGRYHKVANIIGQTMQFHPHGDASIGDALVNLGQKELLIDMQGNWGDIRTGDGAAAPRYIEARLSPLALEILFNPKTTEWQLSYDGRKKEPVKLPVKFPLLLAQGAEGIAVGLSTKLLPHNFVELIDASIEHLKGNDFILYPDFPTGGMIDVSQYNAGERGGKIKVRAKIETIDKKSLIIKEIPFGTTTTSLIESILKANDNGKIKIKQVVDNTAQDVEILISLAPQTSPDVTIAALYAFTDCEQSISPNACIIENAKPEFINVHEILKRSTRNTVELLEKELLILKSELQEKLLYASLEKIFIENRIYRDIEECETFEAVIQTIDKGIEPFKPSFYREIKREDILKLTEIKIKRISKYDSFKADELMKSLEKDLAETLFNLEHLTGYAINYFKRLKDKFSKGHERKTKITTFDAIEATVVAANNAKLYVQKAEGFIGTSLKKEEFVCDCSDIDDVVVFRKDGSMKVVKIADKVFVGKDIVHVEIVRKGDERTVYHLVYLDAKTGRSMVKRFQLGGYTRDRDYILTNEEKGTQVLYFSSNPNAENEKIQIKLSQNCKAKIKVFDFEFSSVDIKGRSAQGNILSKYPVRSIKLLEKGTSTLGGLKIYYDPSVGTLNTDEMGKLLGTFEGEDKIIIFFKDGSYEMQTYELTHRFDPEKIEFIAKFNPDSIYTVLYQDLKTKVSYIKRFKIETTTLQKNFQFISSDKFKYWLSTDLEDANLEIRFSTSDTSTIEKREVYRLSEYEEVKGWKAIGKKVDVPHLLHVQLWEIPTIKPAEPEPPTSEDTALGLFD